MSIDFDILGVGIAAPGLPDWPAFKAVLAGGPIDPEARPTVSQLLSPRERRRAPAAVKLSFAAAEEACAMAGLAPAEPVAVFSSGMGDLDITDYMCRILVETPELLSPTRFHNSVHNAASGYWSIGAGATGDVTAMSGWRDSAVAGLIEVLGRIACEPDPVLVVIYDDVAKGPMSELWPSQQPFCCALILAPAGHERPMMRLRADCQTERRDEQDDAHIERAETGISLPAILQQRIEDNPAARALPLLALIAAGPEAGRVSLAAEYGPGLVFERRPA